MCRMTSPRDVTDELLSRCHDVTELQVTPARRCVESLDNDQQQRHVHHQYRHQQPQPTSTQYISDNCVILTYFTGDVQSNVDEHFARALSRPSSFDSHCHGTTLPSLHTGSSTHSKLRCKLSTGKRQKNVYPVLLHNSPCRIKTRQITTDFQNFFTGESVEFSTNTYCFPCPITSMHVASLCRELKIEICCKLQKYNLKILSYMTKSSNVSCHVAAWILIDY